jgi:Kef-type K+ transport system membrane component KefB
MIDDIISWIMILWLIYVCYSMYKKEKYKQLSQFLIGVFVFLIILYTQIEYQWIPEPDPYRE